MDLHVAREIDPTGPGDSSTRASGLRKVWARPRLSAAVFENLIFALSTVLFFGFGVVIAEQINWSWTLIFYVIVLWAVIAYLALPRLHRILTALYVPNYFIGRTRTANGILGDPVNLAFDGDVEQVHAAMTGAGWTQADPVTLKSSLRIIFSSIARRSYDRAPVSPLLLFGQTQEFAYQQEVEGNPAQRHHVRFWKCPEDWLLPGGSRVEWLAAATFDRSVGISLFTLQVTHKIDSDIDVERDYVTGSIVENVPGVHVHRLENFSTGYHSRNGGGDMISTDGALPVINVSHVPAPTPAAAVADDRSDSAVDSVARRPFSITAALLLSILMVVLSVTGQIQQIESARTEIAEDFSSPEVVEAMTWATIAVVAVVHLLIVVLAWRVFSGSRLARWLALLLITTSQMSQVGQYIGGVRPSFFAMVSMMTGLLIIYAMTSQTARDWTSRPRGRRRPGSRHAAAAG
ncbi:LssY C-terminal domain-containing protein [Corynebacterium pacaense]|uniref:LssY C-terminal domain-containing protein n=1 Tax=Corynebacterium pacaense TaxID=1816684 RepID=UPI001C4DE641|nr:LssY C-terminal domain-containing protein [Corynebacterium pacaense]